MALNGIRVVELAGLAPAPFCGMVLADFGATVIRIDKTKGVLGLDCLANGKKALSLNLKHPKGQEILKKLCRESDVLIEPFRTGVMEKLGLGPNILLADNPKLIYARLTGFGQRGPFSKMAGHDINYVSLSGLSSMLGRKDEIPSPPLNLLADFAGGGLICAFGIVTALLERTKSGKGQVVDASMVEGAAYVGSWIFRSQSLPIWGQNRGENMLDTGSHFYETYRTKDNRFMAVGALEPQFYAELINRLGLSSDDAPQMGDSERLKQVFKKIFAEKTQAEWCNVFDGTDACVTPVLTMEEAAQHPHNKECGSFSTTVDGFPVPCPAPKLSRTPGSSKAQCPDPAAGEHTEEILLGLKYSPSNIRSLEQEGVISTKKQSKL